MTKFTLGHIIKRFQRRAATRAAAHPLKAAESSLEATRRELALFASEMIGAQSYVGQFTRSGFASDPLRQRRLFRDLIETTDLPYMVIDPRPGLHIVDFSKAYAAVMTAERRQLAGSRLFDAFPDNPGDVCASGVSNLFESIRHAAQSGAPHTMMSHRYDVRDASGLFVARYWRTVNTPVFDEAGRLAFILHLVGELAGSGGSGRLTPPAAPGKVGW